MTITDIGGTVQLKNGVLMPYFGLGVFQMKEGEEVRLAVRSAVDTGYRHIDTASLYRNEQGVGKAIRECSVPRKDLFITTKVWNSDQGYDSTMRAFDSSMKLLGIESLDLYLIHWPVKEKYIDTWKALEKLYADGRVRSIGVSNFLKHHLEDLLSHCNIGPMVNQMEFHPRLIQQELIEYCCLHEIQYEAWSPLMQGRIFEVKELHPIAQKYKKDAAQLVLRWSLQKGVVTIPKSIHPGRILSNSQIFDFSISPEDMKKIDALDRNERVGADPNNFNF